MDQTQLSLRQELFKSPPPVRILVVDDDAQHQYVAQEALVGYLGSTGRVLKVETAGTVEEATSKIDQAKASKSPFDLVVSDYEIDENRTGGDRVALAAKAGEGTTTKVIIRSSAFATKKNEILGKCQVDAFLEKPVGLTALAMLADTAMQLLGLNTMPATSVN